MITLKATAEELALSRSVGENAELRKVTLSRLTAINKLKELLPDGGEVKIQFDGPAGRHELPKNGELHTFIKARLTGMGIGDQYSSDADSDLVPFKIEIEYRAIFNIPTDNIPEEIEKKGFAAFAKINGPYICMPYIRQSIQNLVSEMGLQITLPTLLINPKVDQENSE